MSQAGAKPQLLMVDVFHLLCCVLIQRFFTPKCENLCHSLKNGDYVAFKNGCICKPIYCIFVLLLLMSRITFSRARAVNEGGSGLRKVLLQGGTTRPSALSKASGTGLQKARRAVGELPISDCWWEGPFSKDCLKEKAWLGFSPPPATTRDFVS